MLLILSILRDDSPETATVEWRFMTQRNRNPNQNNLTFFGGRQTDTSPPSQGHYFLIPEIPQQWIFPKSGQQNVALNLNIKGRGRFVILSYYNVYTL